MKHVTVTVNVKGESDRNFEVYLDVPEADLSELLESLASKCEDYATDDLGPSDEDEDEDYSSLSHDFSDLDEDDGPFPRHEDEDEDYY